MTLDSATDVAITAAITAAVSTIVVKLLSWLASKTKRVANELQKMQSQKSPESIPKMARDFVVLTALMWMLLKTISHSGEPPSRVEVALIAAWTWATLTYILHMWRTSR